VTLGNQKIDQVGSFTYLGSIISKNGGSSEDVESRIAKAQGERFKEMGTLWVGVKREALNRLGWRRSVPSFVGLRKLGDAMSC
jgi:hypothetical protein